MIEQIERDEKGRFKKKTDLPKPQYEARTGVVKERRIDTNLLAVIAIGIFCVGLALGFMAASDQNTNILSASNTTPQMKEQAQILTLQKALIGSIIDYEVKYGSRSVNWNVGVNF